MRSSQVPDTYDGITPDRCCAHRSSWAGRAPQIALAVGVPDDTGQVAGATGPAETRERVSTPAGR